MAIRSVSVEARATFEFQIDDEATSDWDGATILTVLEQRGKGNDVYTEEATLGSLLGHLGVQLCVEGRTMGNFDGWADFPADSATGNPFSVDWTIEDVQVEHDCQASALAAGGILPVCPICNKAWPRL